MGSGIFGSDLAPLCEECNPQPSRRELIISIVSSIFWVAVMLTVIFWEPPQPTPQISNEQIKQLTPVELARQTAIINEENQRRSRP